MFVTIVKGKGYGDTLIFGRLRLFCTQQCQEWIVVNMECSQYQFRGQNPALVSPWALSPMSSSRYYGMLLSFLPFTEIESCHSWALEAALSAFIISKR